MKPAAPIYEVVEKQTGRKGARDIFIWMIALKISKAV